MERRADSITCRVMGSSGVFITPCQTAVSWLYLQPQVAYLIKSCGPAGRHYGRCFLFLDDRRARHLRRPQSGAFPDLGLDPVTLEKNLPLGSFAAAGNSCAQLRLLQRRQGCQPDVDQLHLLALRPIAISSVSYTHLRAHE